MHFDAQNLNEQYIKETTELKVASIAPRRDIWRLIREEIARPETRPRIPWARVLVTATVVLAIMVLAQLASWYGEERRSSPWGAVAQAYEGLLSLETVKYRVDGSNSDGSRFTQLFQVDFPGQIYYRALWLEDSDPFSGAPNSELLTIEGIQYVRHDDALSDREWQTMGRVSGSDPFQEFADLPWNPITARRFDDVRRLPDEELEGVAVRHYVAERVVVGDSSEIQNDTIHLWLGIDDGLPIKAEHVHEERWSQSGASVDLEKDWCVDSAGHLPEGLTEMEVAYGLPAGVKENADRRVPEHLLEPMVILCWNEERTRGMAVWRKSEIPVGEDGYDLSVTWVYTFTEFNRPLHLPEPLPSARAQTK